MQHNHFGTSLPVEQAHLLFYTASEASRARMPPSFAYPLAYLSRVHFSRYPPSGELARRLRRFELVGTLSNNVDNGSKKVAEKMNFRSFKLNGVYLGPPNVSNAGDFSCT